MVKRVISVILIFSMALALSACGDVPQGDKISIVCTTFAAYDWTSEIVGDNADKFEITLLGGGVDLHSFQPTAGDMAKIHKADLFVQIGGTTEQWTEKLNFENKKALKLLDILKDEEKICTSGDHTQHNHHEDDCDEHIWLSLKLAQPMVNAICEQICDLDAANGVQYQKNCAEYIEKLKNLDKEYSSAVQNSKDKTVVFADRFPFAYMMRDYEIKCISAFDGCSSDTNAGFDTIAHLSEAVKKHNKDTILILENSAESVAAPLKNTLSDGILKTAVMNSCQSISGDLGQSYIDIMTQNLEQLKMALRG